jgi:hypothetical protein
MAAIAAAAIGAAGALGSAGMGMMAGNSQQQAQYDIAAQQMAQQRQNLVNQQIVQALVNQRAVAGSADSFGTTTQYDPATNTWRTNLGQLPMAADTAAIQAGITRNTTDLQQQELINRLAMQRGIPLGDAAQGAAMRLANFRPMDSNTLASLLTQQGVEAARQAYDPLRADVLRSVARTGTAAAPVLRQLGLGEAQNLRNTLNESEISALTNVAGINQTRQQTLANQAANLGALATPQVGQGNLGASGNEALLAQLTSQRAGGAASGTAYGMTGPNYAAGALNTAGGQAIGAVPNPNAALQQTQSGLRDLSTFASSPQGNALAKALGGMFGSGSSNNMPYSGQIAPGAYGMDLALGAPAGTFSPSSYQTQTGGGASSGFQNTGYQPIDAWS